MYKQIYKFASIFETFAKTRWKEEENKQEILQLALERNQAINANQFKALFEKLSKDPNVYFRYVEELRSSFHPRMTHNYRGVYGWSMYNKKLSEILVKCQTAFKTRDYIYFFRITNPSKIIDAELYSENDLQNDLINIKNMYPNMEEQINADNDRLKGDYSFIRLELILDNLSEKLQKPQIDNVEMSPTTYSGNILLRLGYAGIKFPDVIIVFDPSVMENIEVVLNPARSSQNLRGDEASTKLKGTEARRKNKENEDKRLKMLIRDK